MSSHHVHIKNDPRWKAVRLECFDRDDWTCTECGSTEQLQADHIIPLASLFTTLPLIDAIEAALDLDGLTTLCKPCNTRKGSKQDDSPIRGSYVHVGYPELLPIVG